MGARVTTSPPPTFPSGLTEAGWRSGWRWGLTSDFSRDLRLVSEPALLCKWNSHPHARHPPGEKVLARALKTVGAGSQCLR